MNTTKALADFEESIRLNPNYGRAYFRTRHDVVSQIVLRQGHGRFPGEAIRPRSEEAMSYLGRGQMWAEKRRA